MAILYFLILFHFPSEGKTWQSGPEQVNLLELFSSEGCNSCPPADKWLSSLKKHPKLWKTFVPIEFHVDYWNQLGWIDPFSTKTFSNRQRKLAGEWNSNRVYTPGFVLNGKEWKPRNQEFSKQGHKVGTLSVNKDTKGAYQLKFSPQSSNKGSYKVFAALLGNGLITKVRRGENAGRTLQHEFVVLDYKQANMKRDKQSYTAEIHLKSSSKQKPQSMSLAFWVTDGVSLKPIQAVGGDL